MKSMCMYLIALAFVQILTSSAGASQSDDSNILRAIAESSLNNRSSFQTLEVHARHIFGQAKSVSDAHRGVLTKVDVVTTIKWCVNENKSCFERTSKLGEARIGNEAPSTEKSVKVSGDKNSTYTSSGSGLPLDVAILKEKSGVAMTYFSGHAAGNLFEQSDALPAISAVTPFDWGVMGADEAEHPGALIIAYLGGDASVAVSYLGETMMDGELIHEVAIVKHSITRIYSFAASRSYSLCKIQVLGADGTISRVIAVDRFKGFDKDRWFPELITFIYRPEDKTDSYTVSSYVVDSIALDASTVADCLKLTIKAGSRVCKPDHPEQFFKIVKDDLVDLNTVKEWIHELSSTKDTLNHLGAAGPSTTANERGWLRTNIVYINLVALGAVTIVFFLLKRQGR